jgi:hypothetical protein
LSLYILHEENVLESSGLNRTPNRQYSYQQGPFLHQFYILTFSEYLVLLLDFNHTVFK